MRSVVVALVAGVALLAVPGVGAQQPEDAGPSVRFEDRGLEEVVEPRGGAVEVEVPLEVGCDAAETPGTTTTALVDVVSRSPGVGADVEFTLVTWETEAGDCSTPGERPHETTLNVTVFAGREAPAFSQGEVSLLVNLTKTPPEDEAELEREYGPYQANLTFTTGFYPGYDVDVDEGLRMVAPDETAAFSVTIENEANDELAFEMEPTLVPDGASFRAEPSAPTVPVGGTVEVDVFVEPGDRVQWTSESRPVHVEVSGASVNHPDQTVPTSKVGFLLEVQGVSTLSGPATLLIPIGLVAIAVGVPVLRPTR